MSVRISYLCFSAFAALLSGCISLTSFTKHPDSGVSAQVVKVVHQIEYRSRTDAELEKALQKPGLPDALTRACGLDVTTKSVESAVLAPIAVALGRYVFDQIVDAHLKELEKLKKASSSTYSGTVFFNDGAVLKQKKCFLILRTGKDSDVPTFLALIALRDHGGAAFTVEPRYVQAANAVAVTAEDKPALAVSLGMAIKTVAKVKDSPLAEVAAAGQGAVSVTGVKLDKGGSAFTCAPPKCPTSDLVPYPPAKRPISVTISITETGDVGFDLDARSAEIKALKEALGPALTEALKEVVKDDE